MSEDTRYNDDGVWGNYTSVNDMPQFADYIAEHGPFDPREYVVIYRNTNGGYTIDAEPSWRYRADGTVQYLVTWDFEMFEAEGSVDGMWPTSSIGPVHVEFLGERYSLLRTNNEYGDFIVYGVMLNYSDQSGQTPMNALSIPSDHPVLRTYRRHAPEQD